ncbi:membrane protein [Gordonia phage DekHockey33]|nr:membrane protein [Gordonia phage DekHockey33]
MLLYEILWVAGFMSALLGVIALISALVIYIVG